MGNYSVVVLDFETTGLSPDRGDRVIEVGAVLIENNRVADRFQSLMNPGMRISGFMARIGVGPGQHTDFQRKSSKIEVQNGLISRFLAPESAA